MYKTCYNIFMEILEECRLCPRNCKINRLEGKIGFCKAGINPKVALYQVHNFEEPCISGENGSGTVFFTGCNLRCIFCQNYLISQEYKGEEVSIERLADIFIELQEKKVNNINLVTGFMFVPQIIDGIKIAKEKGLNIPIVYNSSGYESLDTLKMLDGIVDIYLPDFKYFYDDLSKEYSGVDNYFEIAIESIKEMKRQKPNNVFDSNGIMKEGVIIRHLILPNNVRNSKRVLQTIKEEFGEDTLVSIMAQYFPEYKAINNSNLNRKITKEELNEVKEYLEYIGLTNGYIQEIEDEEKKYVPKF